MFRTSGAIELWYFYEPPCQSSSLARDRTLGKQKCSQTNNAKTDLSVKQLANYQHLMHEESTNQTTLYDKWCNKLRTRQSKTGSLQQTTLLCNLSFGNISAIKHVGETFL